MIYDTGMGKTFFVSKEIHIDCPYRTTCCDARTSKCKVCRNNKHRSYFEPVDDSPRWPSHPPWRYDPGPTCTTSFFWECNGG